MSFKHFDKCFQFQSIANKTQVVMVETFNICSNSLGTKLPMHSQNKLVYYTTVLVLDRI